MRPHDRDEEHTPSDGVIIAANCNNVDGGEWTHLQRMCKVSPGLGSANKSDVSPLRPLRREELEAVCVRVGLDIIHSMMLAITLASARHFETTLRMRVLVEGFSNACVSSALCASL